MHRGQHWALRIANVSNTPPRPPLSLWLVMVSNGVDNKPVSNSGVSNGTLDSVPDRRDVTDYRWRIHRRSCHRLQTAVYTDLYSVLTRTLYTTVGTSATFVLHIGCLVGPQWNCLSRGSRKVAFTKQGSSQ